MMDMTRYVMKAVDFVLPPRCVVTGDIVDQQGMLSPQAWQRLDFMSGDLCVQCGDVLGYGFDMGQGDCRCDRCLSSPPMFAACRAALAYNDASRDVILRFKHGDQTHLVTSFVQWLSRAGRDMLAEADVLLPVPLHRWRLLSRRYNQAALLAAGVSKACGVAHYPLALRRDRATQSQGHLSVSSRADNVSGAFSVAPRYRDRLRGQRVVLIDDVFTTGATVNECCAVVLAAGAESVSVLTIARTLQDR